MIDLDNQTTLQFALEPLEAIASSLSTSSVELLIVAEETMLSLNNTHRNKASSTDVLSFPMDTSFTQQALMNVPLGSIVISAHYVEEKAKVYGHSIQDELSLLFIHGMLHLMGFDHEIDSGEMRSKEAEIIQTFNLPKSLIVRTGE